MGGPYLVAAFFCEKALHEKDGVLSFIRMVDRWNVTGPTETMPPTLIQAYLVVLMKAGIHRGSAQITITPTKPSGELMPTIAFPVFFEGDEDRGTGVVAPLGFPVQEDGLYWFDVAVDGQAVTKMPLRIVYQRVGQIHGQANP